MINLLAWIALVLVSALVFAFIIRDDRKYVRRLDALENILIDDVLDAVDELCFPLDDFERQNIKSYVRGEYTE